MHVNEIRSLGRSLILVVVVVQVRWGRLQQLRADMLLTASTHGSRHNKQVFRPVASSAAAIFRVGDLPDMTTVKPL